MVEEKFDLNNSFQKKELDIVDKFAIGILPGLMMRFEFDDGYTDRDAIIEAYRLAIYMAKHRQYLEESKEL